MEGKFINAWVSIIFKINVKAEIRIGDLCAWHHSVNRARDRMVVWLGTVVLCGHFESDAYVLEVLVNLRNGVK